MATVEENVLIIHKDKDGNLHIQYPATKWSNIVEAPESMPANGGNADTVDGKHASDLQNYNNLTNKPSTFPPTDHTHDNRYYTESEIDSKLSGKAASNHNHSGVYEPAFTKKTAFNKDFGNASGTVCEGNDSRLSDTRTPKAHTHAKTDVGLGNVPNVTTNNQTPTYTQASTLANLVSGETIATSFGKIMKVIADFISHIGNKSNPHGVTKSQVGLGNVDNTSDASKPISTAVQNALNGKAPSSHTHTKSQITDFPSALKNPTALTAQINGITKTIYDGSAAKTFNVETFNPNLLINGDFQIWQRGTYFGLNQGISSNTFQIYTADRWRIFADTSKKAFKGSIQQVKNGLEVYIMSGADISAFTQMIELNKGLAKELAGKKIAISFKMNNPTGATFNISPTISIVNSSGTYDDTSVIIPIKTGINNYEINLQMPENIEYYDTYPYMRFNLWNVGDILPLTKFEIFNIKLEIGSISTLNKPRSYADELTMCQRYFEYGEFPVYYAYNTSYFLSGFSYKVCKRGGAAPTVTIKEVYDENALISGVSITAFAANSLCVPWLKYGNGSATGLPSSKTLLVKANIDSEIYS